MTLHILNHTHTSHTHTFKHTVYMQYTTHVYVCADGTDQSLMVSQYLISQYAITEHLLHTTPCCVFTSAPCFDTRDEELER